MQIVGRHSATVRRAFPFGPVVLHDERSTTDSRLELTVADLPRRRI